MDVRQPKPGDAVTFVDQHGASHNALLTCVHGEATSDYQPSVNLLYVTGDEAKRDPYGLQIERSSSVVHRGQQGAHGMYWDWS